MNAADLRGQGERRGEEMPQERVYRGAGKKHPFSNGNGDNNEPHRGTGIP